MDYKGHVCPVCNKSFEKGDDVVVCPVCGTPHHRDCYEELGHCFNLNRHRENYDYMREYEVNASFDEEITCSLCGAKNPKESKFCNSCGRPVEDSKAYNNSNQTEGQQNPQGGFGGAFVIDPLGGVKADEDLGEGIKAGEAAKFVKTSTPYFIPQFKQLKERGKTRFSFVGFIFGGGWMLYRKMYKLGTVFTAIMVLLLMADIYTLVYHTDAIKVVDTLYNEATRSMMQNFGFNFYGALGDFFTSLNTEQLIICISRTLISVFTIALRVICGVLGNRFYYKHTIKTISKIKSASASQQEVDTKLNAKGGVNILLALSLIASYYILYYLPIFFLN
ncbi:MAG: DUF2628 domain-containing protein [Clostridia bacterium]|nr:DUF2628 domain-containing protein [Clostridia bacterium]